MPIITDVKAKKNPTNAVRRAIVHLNEAYGDAYEIAPSTQTAEEVTVTNPASGKSVQVRILPGENRRITSTGLRLRSRPKQGDALDIDWDGPAAPSAFGEPALRKTLLPIAKAHIGEFRLGDGYASIPLSDGEQRSVADAIAAQYANDGTGFVCVGSHDDERIIVPTSAGWLSAVIETSLANPMGVTSQREYAMLRSRFPFFKRTLTDLGVPADAITFDADSDSSRDGRALISLTGMDVLWNRLSTEVRTRYLDLPSMRCKLIQRGRLFEAQVCDEERIGVSVGVNSEMRHGVRLKRMQDDRPLAETKGGTMLAEALA